MIQPQITQFYGCEFTDRKNQDWLEKDDYLNFPSIDLKTIEELWVNYSNSLFGFSVLKRIWKNVGGHPDADWTTIKKFADAVGWRKGGEWLYEKNLNFNLTVPKGHLPCDSLCNYTLL